MNSERCPVCRSASPKIITIGHGGIQRNDAEWVRSVSRFFEMDGYPKMETVQDVRKFYAEHPNVKPAESHPAFPSSVGDIERLKPFEERMSARKKKAVDLVRKDEALTVTGRSIA